MNMWKKIQVVRHCREASGKNRQRDQELLAHARRETPQN